MFMISEGFYSNETLAELDHSYLQFASYSERQSTLSKFFFENYGTGFYEIEGNVDVSKNDAKSLAHFISRVIKPGTETMIALHDDSKGAIMGFEIRRDQVDEIVIPQSPKKYMCIDQENEEMQMVA